MIIPALSGLFRKNGTKHQDLKDMEVADLIEGTIIRIWIILVLQEIIMDKVELIFQITEGMTGKILDIGTMGMEVIGAKVTVTIKNLIK